MREAADCDAERTREEAVEKARAHVAAVAQVAATLLERVGAMDGEVRGLVDSLRSGASRLAGDLAGGGDEHGRALRRRRRAGARREPQPQQPRAAGPVRRRASPERCRPAPAAAARPRSQPAADAPSPPPPQAAPGAEGSGDLDGARLIALNMALNGESRADTERYLAENFQLPDRMKLVDEVYAAIEG